MMDGGMMGMDQLMKAMSFQIINEDMGVPESEICLEKALHPNESRYGPLHVCSSQCICQVSLVGTCVRVLYVPLFEAFS